MTLRRILASLIGMWLTATPLVAQESFPPDSPRWKLEGRTQVTDFEGRRCLMLDGGTAGIQGLTWQDGTIDVDVATPAARGFFGIQFRADSVNSEFVYLRQHKSGLPDAMQYTPVLNTGLNWQIYSGPGFIGAVDIPRNSWFRLRLEVSGAQGKLFVGDTTKPALIMPDLKSGVRTGELGLVVLTGATCFTNVVVRHAAPAPWRRFLPAIAPGTIVRWALSPSFDALARDLERPLAASEVASIRWEDVDAEAPGFVVVNRHRDSPHPRVTFQTDFSKRLDPQPGTRVVYARTTIVAERDETRKLSLGYSDDVSVFLNGRILYRGRSAQSFRDPAFLGIIDVENDAVYLPLRPGRNELILAVSELGGGWGFIARLAEAAGRR